ncbi:MAG TPA: hypothetical protein VK131_11965, partial [Candidatus Acidoferrales bacterium]|nr:hypothetical protein [Candidatus Acidoferrales bacterium]
MLLLAAGACGPAARPPPASPSAAASAGSSVQWLTYHGDGARSGRGPALPALGTPHLAWSSEALDGDLYASPLIAG